MAGPDGEKEWQQQDDKEAGLSNLDLEAKEPFEQEPVPSVAVDKELGLRREPTSNSINELDAARSGTRTSFARSQSRATDVTEDVETTDSEEERKKKRWYKRMNPLKWGSKPKVPEERMVSREYTAGFWSLLTFQWMAPLMNVGVSAPGTISLMWSALTVVCFQVGYLRTLELNDIWTVNPDRSAEKMANKLGASFKKRVDRGDKRPLIGALYETYKFEFILGGACQLVASIIMVLSPFTLKYLIRFANRAYVANRTGSPAPSIGEGLGLVFGITIMQTVQSFGSNQFMYRGMMVGGQCRSALIAVIFNKAMKISGRAKAGGKALDSPPADVKAGSEAEKKWYEKILKRKAKEGKNKGTDGVLGDGHGWGNGRIINLMSTDTYRIDQASGFFHLIWTSPVAIFLTLALLIVNLTYSALAGFGLLVATMPLLGMAIRSLLKRRMAINKVTDQRVSLTQEILQAVRFVKFFGWETSFLERISAVRSREIRSIQFLLAIRNGINAVSMSMPIFASMIAFITYSLTNHALDPAPIFSSLALFNALRLPLNLLPLVIGQVTDASDSIHRIEEFLLAEEVQDDFELDMKNESAVVIDHGEFTWERNTTQDQEDGPEKGSHADKKAKKDKSHKKKANKSGEKAEKAEHKDGSDSTDGSSTLTEQEPFKLHDIDLAIKRNELIAVIGNVGSGKSSLLAALAGDMRRTSGKVTLGASRAFCPQYAWIQNTTVRDNIIFGKEFDQAWYDTVVDACALRPDLEMLPNGDMTEIGERGITVSGGQKQRLNIARAIYFNADIILMDDPLSAVDAHVGRHIMDHGICGLLKNKCRVLATHQLHVLNRCDRIVWMNEGKIEAVDTFDNMMAHNEEFGKLMATTAIENNDEDDGEGPEGKKRKRKNKKNAHGLMQAEERAVKSVSWGVYLAYIKASGSIMFAPLVLSLLIASQGANIVTGLWLSWWTSNKFGFSTGIYVRFIGFTSLNSVADQSLDRYLRGSGLYPSLSHVCILNILVRIRYHGQQGHARSSNDPGPQSANVVFRHHATRSHYEQILKRRGHHGQQPYRLDANVFPHDGHDRLSLRSYHCIFPTVRDRFGTAHVDVHFLCWLLPVVGARDQTSRGRASERCVFTFQRGHIRHFQHSGIWTSRSIFRNTSCGHRRYE